MKLRYAFAVAALLFAPAAFAVDQCVCTSGCKILTNILTGAANQTPTTCNVYSMPGHALIGTAPVVDATSAGPIPPNNSTTCIPSQNFSYGAAGSLACLVPIPAQPAGTSPTVVATTANVAGESADSTAYTFQSVPSLTQKPSVPVIKGVTN